MTPSSTDLEDSGWIKPGLNVGGKYLVQEQIDGQALGSWATVVKATPVGGGAAVALKIMRGRHLENAETYLMFGHEARVLEQFGAEASSTQLLAAGFLREPPATGAPAPAEMAPNVAIFEAELVKRKAAGWRPFLVLSLVPFSRTLLALVRQLSSSHEDALRNLMLPLWEALAITSQGLEVLAALHSHKVFYIDHKPEHSIWHDGIFRFIDWNGGKQLAKSASTGDVGALAQHDILMFISYVAYPLFVGRQIDGGQIRSIVRGTPMPPPVQVADDQALAFFDAHKWLEEELRLILSKPFWSPARRYPSAAEMAAALRDYEDRWRRTGGGLDRKLVTVVQELRRSEYNLAEAQEQLQEMLRGRLFAKPAAARPPICLEVQRLAQHVQRYVDQRPLPLGEQAPDAAPSELVAAAPAASSANGRSAAAPPANVAAEKNQVAPPTTTAPRAAATGAAPTGASSSAAAIQVPTQPVQAPPGMWLLWESFKGMNLKTMRATFTKALTEVKQQAQSTDLTWQAALALVEISAVIAGESEDALQNNGLSTPSGRLSARIGKVLREAIMAALIVPNSNPAMVPTATLQWMATKQVPTGAACVAAREAFVAVLELYSSAAGSLDPKTYAAKLAALVDRPGSPLRFLMEEIDPLREVVVAILSGAREVAFNRIQEALAAGDSPEARNWFDAVVR